MTETRNEEAAERAHRFVQQIIEETVRWNVFKTPLRFRVYRFFYKVKAWVVLIWKLRKAMRSGEIERFTLPRWSKEGFRYTVVPVQPAEFIWVDMSIREMKSDE